MKVTYYDYEPGGGRVMRSRGNLHNVEVKKTGDGLGPYVFADPGAFADYGLPSIIVCKARDLVKVEDE